MAQLVKNLPPVQETWIQSLGWEGPLEKGKATAPVFSSGNSMDCTAHGVAESDATDGRSRHFISHSHTHMLPWCMASVHTHCDPSASPVTPAQAP